MHDDDWAPTATMADAHREWHRNAGVPMGQPGCPQDACDPPPPDDDEDEDGGWERRPDLDGELDDGRKFAVRSRPVMAAPRCHYDTAKMHGGGRRPAEWLVTSPVLGPDHPSARAVCGTHLVRAVRAVEHAAHYDRVTVERVTP